MAGGKKKKIESERTFLHGPRALIIGAKRSD